MLQFSRQFANPSADTFSIPPIGDFVKRYLRNSKVSIDPFARNNLWATWTNDLNPETAADFHMPALDFLRMMKQRDQRADLVIFDPPYSRRQVMEVYAGIGREHTNEDSQYFSLNWKEEREAVDDLLEVGGVVLSFGWHSNGMRQSGCYEPVEMLIVTHGGAHYDTLCIAERKIAHQAELIGV